MKVKGKIANFFANVHEKLGWYYISRDYRENGINIILIPIEIITLFYFPLYYITFYFYRKYKHE